MSATIVDGSTIFVQADAANIGINQNATISFSGDTRETNYKGSGNFIRRRANKGSFSISCSGLWDNADAGQQAVDAAVFTVDREVTIIFPWDGTNKTGVFVITAAEKTANDQEDGTYSYTFESAGNITTVV